MLRFGKISNKIKCVIEINLIVLAFAIKQNDIKYGYTYIRKFTISKAFSDIMICEIIKIMPKCIVEFSSDVTRVFMIYYFEQIGLGKVILFDHIEQHAVEPRNMLS